MNGASLRWVGRKAWDSLGAVCAGGTTGDSRRDAGATTVPGGRAGRASVGWAGRGGWGLREGMGFAAAKGQAQAVEIHIDDRGRE